MKLTPPTSLLSLAFCITPAICLAEGEPTNLIVNPSLEDDLAGRRLPAGWSPYVDTDKNYRYEVVEGGHTGKRSLMISGQGTRIHVFANGVRIDRTKRYVLRGWVRFEGDCDGWSMIKFNYRKGGRNYYIPGGDRISAGHEEWQFQTKTDRADEAPEADMLWVSCKLEGNGKAYFDDLELIAYDRASLPKDFDLKHGKSNRVAAWQILQRRVGKWKTETTFKPGRWIPNGARTAGTDTIRWALGQKFIRGEGQTVGTDGRSMHQITFDERLNVYRMWHFSSEGHFPRAPFIGRWDEKSQTLTFKATEPGNIEIVVATKYVSDDLITMSATWTKDGEVTMEMEVKSTRVGTQAAVTPGGEQQVLNQFIGSWSTEYTLPKAEWTPEEITRSAKLTFSRVLDGKYVQEQATHSDKLGAPLAKGMVMYTYDTQRKSYRAWWFSSDGQSSETTGRWDAGTKTFSWKSVAEPNQTFTTTGSHRFVSDDAFEWTVVVKDMAGKVKFRMEGKAKGIEGGKENH